MEKESLLLKIVTLGGIAEQKMIKKCLEKSAHPLSWSNFQCSKDYAVRLFWFINLGGSQIGLNGI